MEELKSLLEGKTILKIEPPTSREHICKFVMQDGSSFELGATDLGWWVDNKRYPDGLYHNLQDIANILWNDRYNYKFDEIDNLLDPQIIIESGMLIIDDGQLFQMRLDHLTEDQKAFIQDTDGLKKMATSLACGLVPSTSAYWLNNKA